MTFNNIQIPVRGVYFVFLSAILLFLSACSPSTPVSTVIPTQDSGTIVAAAVNTISAQMTNEALNNPTATPQPSNTPVPPTSTPELPTATLAPTLEPTQTATQPPAVSAEFLYAATYPENKREYVPNEEFGLALGFKNTGTMTWQPGSKLKIVNFEGEITVQQEIELGSAIAPGEKVEFNLWAFGSETLGKHVWVFQLYTPQGGAVPGGVGVFSYTAK